MTEGESLRERVAAASSFDMDTLEDMGDDEVNVLAESVGVDGVGESGGMGDVPEEVRDMMERIEEVRDDIEENRRRLRDLRERYNLTPEDVERLRAAANGDEDGVSDDETRPSALARAEQIDRKRGVSGANGGTGDAVDVDGMARRKGVLASESYEEGDG
jgi:hypothetical protein